MDPIGRTLLTAYHWLIAHRDHLLWAGYALAAFSAVMILLRFSQGRHIVKRGRLYQIAVPQGSDVKPFAAEQMFAALHGLQEHWGRRFLHGLDHVGLEIAADRSGLRFFVWAPERIADSVVRLVHSAYEEADIRLVENDYLLGPGQDALGTSHCFPHVRRRRKRQVGARMTLLHDIAYPIKTLREFEKTDPLAAITAAMAGLEEGEGMVVQLLLQPGGDWELAQRAKRGITRLERRRRIQQATPDGRRVQFMREATPQEHQRFIAIGGKQAKLSFRVSLRLLSIAPHQRPAYARLRGLAAAFGQFSVPILNGWRRRIVWFAKRSLFLRQLHHRAFPLWGRRKSHRPLSGEQDILSIEELASLWHLPHPEVVQTPGIVWSLSRKRAAARLPQMDSPHGLVIARTSYRGEHRDIALPPSGLFSHIGVIGKWGAGKTTLLVRLALECIEQRIAVVLLDPHGDLCDKLLPRIPAKHHERVIYFNPAADLDRPMGLNFLEPEPGQHPSQVKSEAHTMLTHLFGEQLIGPRSSYVLANCIQTLQDVGGMTILEVSNLLVDETFRERAILQLCNPEVQSFWYRFYQPLLKKNPRLQMDVISPVLNKIGAFATDPRLAYVVGQTRSAFRLREIMDEGKVLICNLTQGGLGLDNSRLLGGSITSRVIQAAMARENIPEAERRPAVLIADEFHVWVGPAFPQALPQLRKYKLGMVLACQLVAQLEQIQGMRSAFLSTGTLCVFKAAAEDGGRLATEFTGFFDANDLIRMDPFQVAIRIASERETIPFSGETIPLEESTYCDPVGARSIHEACREKYGRPVDEVKDEIRQRAALAVPPEEEQDWSLCDEPQMQAAGSWEVFDVPEI